MNRFYMGGIVVNRMKVILALVLALLVSAVPFPKTTDTVQASVGLSNPKIISDTSLKSGKKVTWDCVWFGSYPQREVMTSEMKKRLSNNLSQCVLYEDHFIPDGAVVEDDELYQKLKKATGWNQSNDITIDGTRYHRMKWT